MQYHRRNQQWLHLLQQQVSIAGQGKVCGGRATVGTWWGCGPHGQQETQVADLWDAQITRLDVWLK